VTQEWFKNGSLRSPHSVTWMRGRVWLTIIMPIVSSGSVSDPLTDVTHSLTCLSESVSGVDRHRAVSCEGGLHLTQTYYSFLIHLHLQWTDCSVASCGPHEPNKEPKGTLDVMGPTVRIMIRSCDGKSRSTIHGLYFQGIPRPLSICGLIYWPPYAKEGSGQSSEPSKWLPRVKGLPVWSQSVPTEWTQWTAVFSYSCGLSVGLLTNCALKLPRYQR